MSGGFVHIHRFVVVAVMLSGALALLSASAPSPSWVDAPPSHATAASSWRSVTLPALATASEGLGGMVPSPAGLGVLRLDVLDTILPGARTFLEPNAPNPFAQRTRIGFSISGKGMVTLRVFDFWYREVATLVNEERNPGRYLAFFDVSLIDPVPDSGMYFYELRFGGETIQRRMLLVK